MSTLKWLIIGFIILLVIIALILIIIFYVSRKPKDDFPTNDGEKAVNKMLSTIKSRYYAYQFNNYTFKSKSKTTHNIDHIFVCQGGIFVIETKSLRGKISAASDKQDTWMVHKKGETYNFKNPINQNKTHINHLRVYLDNKYFLNSMVIFPFAYPVIKIKSHYIFNVATAYDSIVDKINREYYSIEEVDEIYKKLNQILKKHHVSYKKHIKTIQKNNR